MSVTTDSYTQGPLDAVVLAESPATHQNIPIIVEPDAEAEERGRLKRRRLSSHSPPRAASPSRGHDRSSGSRHRHHHRNHHRDSESASMTPPPTTQKKQRRRSDAEQDHTFRGRARNRSGTRERSGSPIFEDDDVSEEEMRELRKRAQPPSRPRADGEEDKSELRRQRSYPNLYIKERKDSKSETQAKRPHPLRQELAD